MARTFFAEHYDVTVKLTFDLLDIKCNCSIILSYQTSCTYHIYHHIKVTVNFDHRKLIYFILQYKWTSVLISRNCLKVVLRYCAHKKEMVKLKTQSYTVYVHILSSQIELISSKHEHLKPDNLPSKD